MSTHFKIVAEFDTDPEPFWRLFFHEPYNVALYERIGVIERKLLYKNEDDTTIKFSVHIIPKKQLPSVLQKVIGGQVGYTEISVYHKGKHTIDVRTEPTLMKDKWKMMAKYTLTPTAPGKVRRVFEGDINVAVPLVGGRIEKAVIDDMTRSYDVAAQVTREWLKKGL